jgi:pimeloyl-ACP methyl ester carboxylesterase
MDQFVMIPSGKDKNRLSLLYFDECDDRTYPWTILYSHGNAEDLQHSAPTFYELAATLRVNLVVYDYSGYGASDGSPSEATAYSNVQTVLKWLIKEKGIPKKYIILFGRSLGSGPTIELASKHTDLAGLILQSPLRSAISTQISGWALKMLSGLDIFRNQDKVKYITNYPVFIIHGDRDEVVPFAHGQYLFKELQQVNKLLWEPWWVKGCGHNDIEYRKEFEFKRRLKQFVDHVKKRGTASGANRDGDVVEEEKDEQ